MNGKKKLVVPLVAIMMCAVALAGVVYAYSASVTVNDNSEDVDFFAIDLYQTDGTTPVNAKLNITDAGLVVTTVTTITADKTIVATVNQVDDKPIYVFGFKVTSEDSTKFTVKNTSTATITANTTGIGLLDPAVTTTTALAITGELRIYTTSACTVEATGQLNVGTTYYAAVEVASITPGVYSYTGTDYTANTLADAIEGAIILTFGITLEVEPAVAA